VFLPEKSIALVAEYPFVLTLHSLTPSDSHVGVLQSNLTEARSKLNCFPSSTVSGCCAPFPALITKLQGSSVVVVVSSPIVDVISSSVEVEVVAIASLVFGSIVVVAGACVVEGDCVDAGVEMSSNKSKYFIYFLFADLF
jgi:hypothetical protein